MSRRKQALIFANGRIDNLEAVSRFRGVDNLIIAADGGARHCQKLGIMPNVLIGDFDSLNEAELIIYEKAGAEIIRHPARKDYTDLELALLHAKSIGATQAIVFGGLGLRWDQTLANLLLPASNELSQMRIQLIDGNQEITVLHAGDEYEFHGSPGDTVSLIPLNAETTGISTQGLEYPLANESLVFGSTRGISNVLVGTTASLHLEKGLLLCVVIHH